MISHFPFAISGERLGRGIVTDAITTPVVNTSAYFFKTTAELIDFKVRMMVALAHYMLLISEAKIYFH